jgi:hypothetical protein
MEINSPVGNFIDLIAKVKKSAVAYQSKLLRNEAATRAVLIDPILKALGWDISNPDMVEFERFYRDTKVDYALYDQEGKVRIIVEAKALGGNLSDLKILTSLVSYGFTYGIQELFLTNGLVWQHFYQLRPGEMEPKELDISKDSLGHVASYLIENLDAAKYWSKNTSKEELKEKEEEEEVKPTHFLVGQPETFAQITNPRQVSRKPVISSREPNPVFDGTNFIELDALNIDTRGKSPPRRLRLPDGSIKEISRWRDILSNCVLFVLAHQPNLQIPLPDRVGKTVYLLNHTHIEGVTNIETSYNGRTIYIYLNYSSNNCLSNAKYILSFLPRDMEKVPAAISFQ